MKKIFFLLITAVAVFTVVTINSCKKDDTSPPVITVTGDNPATVVLGTAYSDAGATAHDDNDGNVSVSSSGSVDVTTAGTYTITYSSSDAAGNQASAHRTVNVVITRANYVWAGYNCNDSCTTNSTIGAFGYSGNIAAGTAADAIIISNFSGTSQICIATVSGATVTIPSQTVGAFTMVGSGTMNNKGDKITIDYSDGTNSFHAVFNKL
jgi:redox-sensitive bicupin YhaK (pirin superfamily)